MQPVRVMLLEPDDGAARRLSADLAAAAGAIVVAQVHTLAELMLLLLSQATDLVVIGTGVSWEDLSEAVGAIRSSRPSAKIVKLVGGPAAGRRAGLRVTSTSGKVDRKEGAGSEGLVDAAVPEGNCRILVSRILKWYPNGSECARNEEPLTECEREVVRLAAQGHSNREIARLRHRSPNTIKSELKSAMEKLAIHRRGRLAEWWRNSESPPQIHPNG